MSAAAGATPKQLRPGEVHLWFPPQAIDRRNRLAEEGADLLSPAEQERRDAISHPSVQRRFVLGRVLTRRALSHYLATPPAEIDIDRTEQGAPVLVAPAGSGLAFSLSHSGKEMVLAVARARRLGVDLEDAGRAGTALEVGGHFFSEEERARLQALGDDAPAQALMLWSLKESVVKALGASVWEGLKGVRLAIEGRALRWLSPPPGDADAGAWQLAAGHWGDGHILALAVDRGDICPEPLSCRCYTLGEGGGAEPFQPLCRTSAVKNSAG